MCARACWRFVCKQAAARPVVSVFDAKSGSKGEAVALPAVFTAPIRNDVVSFVHTNISKNKRQAYAVAFEAGHQVNIIQHNDSFWLSMQHA